MSVSHTIFFDVLLANKTFLFKEEARLGVLSTSDGDQGQMAKVSQRGHHLMSFFIISQSSVLIPTHHFFFLGIAVLISQLGEYKYRVENALKPSLIPSKQAAISDGSNH